MSLGDVSRFFQHAPPEIIQQVLESLIDFKPDTTEQIGDCMANNFRGSLPLLSPWTYTEFLDLLRNIQWSCPNYTSPCSSRHKTRCTVYGDLGKDLEVRLFEFPWERYHLQRECRNNNI